MRMTKSRVIKVKLELRLKLGSCPSYLLMIVRRVSFTKRLSLKHLIVILWSSLMKLVMKIFRFGCPKKGSPVSCDEELNLTNQACSLILKARDPLDETPSEYCKNKKAS